jgi:tetratricopeptide (TPR) repeat protein
MLAEYEAARTAFFKALPLFEQVGDRLGLAHTYRSLGHMELQQKNWQPALDFYNQALPLARAVQARLTQANILIDNGVANFEIGNHEIGMAEVREAISLYRAVHDERWAQIAEERLATLESRWQERNPPPVL